jgi:hypothetical protein
MVIGVCQCAINELCGSFFLYRFFLLVSRFSRFYCFDFLTCLLVLRALSLFLSHFYCLFIAFLSLFYCYFIAFLSLFYCFFYCFCIACLLLLYRLFIAFVSLVYCFFVAFLLLFVTILSLCYRLLITF